MQDIPLLWNQTGKKASDEDELRTEENRFFGQCNKIKGGGGGGGPGKGKDVNHTKSGQKKKIFFSAWKKG